MPREIAQTVKSRIERALLTIHWTDVSDEDEMSQPASSMRSDALQAVVADSYDYSSDGLTYRAADLPGTDSDPNTFIKVVSTYKRP